MSAQFLLFNFLSTNSIPQVDFLEIGVYILDTWWSKIWTVLAAINGKTYYFFNASNCLMLKFQKASYWFFSLMDMRIIILVIIIITVLVFDKEKYKHGIYSLFCHRVCVKLALWTRHLLRINSSCRAGKCPAEPANPQSTRSSFFYFASTRFALPVQCKLKQCVNYSEMKQFFCQKKLFEKFSCFFGIFF